MYKLEYRYLIFQLFLIKSWPNLDGILCITRNLSFYLFVFALGNEAECVYVTSSKCSINCELKKIIAMAKGPRWKRRHWSQFPTVVIKLWWLNHELHLYYPTHYAVFLSSIYIRKILGRFPWAWLEPKSPALVSSHACTGTTSSSGTTTRTI